MTDKINPIGMRVRHKIHERTGVVRQSDGDGSFLWVDWDSRPEDTGKYIVSHCWYKFLMFRVPAGRRVIT